MVLLDFEASRLSLTCRLCGKNTKGWSIGLPSRERPQVFPNGIKVYWERGSDRR